MPLAKDAKFEVGKIYDLVPGVLGFVQASNEQILSLIRQQKSLKFFTSDFHAEYHPFEADFGPVDLGVIYQFCNLARDKLREFHGPNPKTRKQIVYYFGNSEANLINSFLLLGCFAIVHLNISAQDAYGAFHRFKPCPFPKYRDASPSFKKSTFDVTLQDCLYGFATAQSNGWLSADASVQLENYISWKRDGMGEFHYVTPRLVSFKGPMAVRKMICPGLFTCEPIDYVDVFLEHNVTCVIRLNTPDKHSMKALERAQIRVCTFKTDNEMLPSMELATSVLKIMMEEDGVVVLHSRYGIRATGVLLCMYLMAKEGFTATQSIGWLRTVSPQATFYLLILQLGLITDRPLTAGDHATGTSRLHCWHAAAHSVWVLGAYARI